jgi:hypothetical protein
MHGLSHAVLLHIWHSDAGRNIPPTRKSLQEIFRKYSGNMKLEDGTSPSKLPLIVVLHESDEEDAKTVQAVKHEIETVWNEMNNNNNNKVEANIDDRVPFDSVIDISIHSLCRNVEGQSDRYQREVDSLKECVLKKHEELVKNDVTSFKIENLREALMSNWKKIKSSSSSSSSPSHYEHKDRIGVFLVEEAYRKALLKTRQLLSEMRHVAEKGGTVPKFGSKITVGYILFF